MSYSFQSFLVFILVSVAIVGFGQDKPNVLLIIVDDLRPELGVYGINRAITPNIDALAEEAVVFNNAYTSYPLCSPSRAALLTGRSFRFFNDPEGEGFPTHAEVIDSYVTMTQTLKGNGYMTSSLGKVHHNGVPSSEEQHWDLVYKPASGNKVAKELWNEMPDHYKGGEINSVTYFGDSIKSFGALVWGMLDVEDNRFGDGLYAEKAVSIIRDSEDEPFFMALGFQKPHLPFFAPKKYFDWYDTSNISLAAIPHDKSGTLMERDSTEKNRGLWNEGVPDETSRKLIVGYLATVSYVDKLIGDVIAQLKASNKYENTLIIFWGDNGFHLTEHGLYRKNTPWLIASKTPLMLKLPNQTSVFVSNEIVTNLDIYPTTLDLLGIEDPTLNLSGKSLRPILENSRLRAPRNAFVNGKTFLGLVNKRYHFILDSLSDARELYDIRVDPDEWYNLADDPSFKRKIRRFERIIYGELSTTAALEQGLNSDEPAYTIHHTLTDEHLYPNPSGGNFFLKANQVQELSYYEVHDLGGNVHASGVLKNNQMNLFLPKGNYFVRIYDHDGRLAVSEQVLITE